MDGGGGKRVLGVRGEFGEFRGLVGGSELGSSEAFG